MDNPLEQRRKLPAGQVAPTLQQGIAAQRAGDFKRAEFFYQSVLRDHPKNSDALNLMGTIALEAKKPEIATGYFRKALKKHPRNPIFLYNLGSAQLKDHKPQHAVDTLRKASLIKPDYAMTWVMLGRAEVQLGRHEQALASFDRAVALRGDKISAVEVERGEVLVNLGRMTEAADVFSAAIAQNVEMVRAMAGLSMARKFKPEDPEPLQMAQHLEQAELTQTQRNTLRYAAGKAFADQKNFDAAFTQFATAKEEADNTFAIDLHREAFQRLKDLFTKEFFEARADIGSPSQRPIFVIGMPRSGTTLTEQILASHPQITGAGELSDMRKLAAELGHGNMDKSLYARNLTNMTSGQARKIAGKYLAVLKRYSGTAQRVVDKMPHNYELMGLIALLFPNATVIHCQRSAMDTCVSCFTQNFSKAHGYNADLRSLGQYYRAYDDLMQHWHSVLPGRILDSHYENMINDQEAASRRLIARTGLEWDDACLSFEKTERLVTTPSRWQVRQPIYKTSLKSWQKYESHLGPLQKALGPLAET